MTVLENYLVDSGYLVMTYDNGSCEVYNRNYKFISNDMAVASEIQATKNLLQTWKEYPVYFLTFKTYRLSIIKY